MLANFCSGELEQTKYLLDIKFLEKVGHLMEKPLMSDILSNIAFSMANLVGTPEVRDLVRKHPIVTLILRKFTESKQTGNLELVQSMSYLCSNLLAFPYPHLGFARAIMILITRFLKSYRDKEDITLECVAAVCFFLSSEDNMEDRKSFLLGTGLIEIIADLLSSEDQRIVRYCLEVLIPWTNPPRSEYVDFLLNMKFNSDVYRTTGASNSKIKLLGLKLIGNLISGADHHRRYISSPQLMNILKTRITNSTEKLEVRTEAASVLKNYVYNCQEAEQKELLDYYREVGVVYGAVGGCNSIVHQEQ